MMNVRKTDLAGVLLIEPDRFGDHHGFFLLKPIINDYMLGLESMPTSLGQSLTFGIRVRCGGFIFRYHRTLKTSWCAAGQGQFLIWLLIYEGKVQLTGSGQAASSAPQMAYRCSFQQTLRTGS